MKVFVCTDHDGHWPVGVASVVVAPDSATAIAMLNDELFHRGLALSDKHPFTLKEIDATKPIALMLCDGDY